MSKPKRKRKPEARPTHWIFGPYGVSFECPQWLYDRLMTHAESLSKAGLIEICVRAIELFERGVVTGETAPLKLACALQDVAAATYYKKHNLFCHADAEDELGRKLAAPIGQEPRWGQPGRWPVETLGCRVDFRTDGLFGSGGGECWVIDVDKPFISETGFRSLTSMAFPAPDETPTQWAARIIAAEMSRDGNGRPCKPKMVTVEGWTVWRGKERENTPYRHDEDDAAWRPGGFYYRLAGPPAPSALVEAGGQLAMGF